MEVLIVNLDLGVLDSFLVEALVIQIFTLTITGSENSFAEMSRSIVQLLNALHATNKYLQT